MQENEYPIGYFGLHQYGPTRNIVRLILYGIGIKHLHFQQLGISFSSLKRNETCLGNNNRDGNKFSFFFSF